MIPAKHEILVQMDGNGNESADGYGSSSRLYLSQQQNLMEGCHLVQPVKRANSTNSGSDNQDDTAFGDVDQENINADKLGKRKRYNRHTQHQIQQMEAFFRECPHPDDKQRKELGRELGLQPAQIKFWFQNKRTQMKTQHERIENSQLRADNEKLRVDNMRYREAVNNASCPNCGGPTTTGETLFEHHHLMLENSHLREEIDRISAIVGKYVGKPVTSNPIISSPVTPKLENLGFGNTIGGKMYGAMDLLRLINGLSEADKPKIVELAVGAMEEMIKMAQMGEPLWLTGGSDGSTTLLNEEEYFRSFPSGLGSRPAGFKYEASRETAVVIMNHIDLVQILMDVNKWSTLFSGIVSRAATVEVLSTGVGGDHDGALQVISAEFQVPSPLVATRESYFARYCKQHVDGIWAVVDVSLDSLRPGPLVNSRRRPSGCLIQEMPNGYSRVTWIEHVEVEDGGVHNLYKPIVYSGLAFGAKRWITTLDRQCERLASAMATTVPANDVTNTVITSQEGRKSILKLAERMVISFCSCVSASTARTWTTLSGSGAGDVRVMTRKSVDDPGRPPGIVLSAATSFWLPVPPNKVFDFLRDGNSRNEWDILSNGGVIREIAHIANGREPGNCVSLLRVNSENWSQSNMLILQESCWDPIASFVIYAPVDIAAMNVVLAGGDPEYVALLPSGFAILPDGQLTDGKVADAGKTESGSLLTVAFQILVDSMPTGKLSLDSVATVNNLITCTVDRIKSAIVGESA